MTENFIIPYTASKHVRDVIAALGRTEDVRFSPSNRRLAVASFSENRIAIFDISIASNDGQKISITDVTEISSPYLSQPHGIDFFDEDTIIVANRTGDVAIFRILKTGGRQNILPLQVIRRSEILTGPGCVWLKRKEATVYEALVCDNWGDRVTRHTIELGDDVLIKSNKIYLKKWLALPDGIAASGKWIAISNHDCRTVLLYDSSRPLDEHSDPDGILCYMHYPHGVRFSSDDHFLFVADAGSPHVHIFRRDSAGWHGVRKPLKSIRVLEEQDFLRGRVTFEEGGPKGIDIENSTSTLVTTCRVQPLRFFDLSRVMETVSLSLNRSDRALPGSGEALDREQMALEIKYELERLPCSTQDELRFQIAQLTNSRSYRYTAPFRWALVAMHGFTRTLSKAFKKNGKRTAVSQA